MRPTAVAGEESCSNSEPDMVIDLIGDLYDAHSGEVLGNLRKGGSE